MNPEQLLAIAGVAGLLGGLTLYFRSQALIKLQQAEIDAYKEKVERVLESMHEFEKRAAIAEQEAETLKRLFIEIVGKSPDVKKYRKPTKKRG